VGIFQIADMQHRQGRPNTRTTRCVQCIDIVQIIARIKTFQCSGQFMRYFKTVIAWRFLLTDVSINKI